MQSLGRQGIPVWVLSESGRGVADFSRFCGRSVAWRGRSEVGRVEFLLRTAEREGLDGWVLIPTRDDTVALCARHREALAQLFRVTSAPWEIVRRVLDKRELQRLGEEIGVPVPRTWKTTHGSVSNVRCEFPVIVKPAVREELNVLTASKAWRADDRAALVALYERARSVVPEDEILIQELIPGDGSNQLSFAALASDGEVRCSVTARRVRQYPMDFGRASTFVETIDDDAVRAQATRVIAALGYSGLVEVEFKRDPRTDEAKLLDVNARLWGWHTLGRRAGVDFPFLLWRLAQGDLPEPCSGTVGTRWVWPIADIPTAVSEMLAGRLGPRDYARSFRRPLDLATLTLDDPLPALLEMPLMAFARLRARQRRGAASVDALHSSPSVAT